LRTSGIESWTLGFVSSGVPRFEVLKVGMNTSKRMSMNVYPGFVSKLRDVLAWNRIFNERWLARLVAAIG
jgi:hypothetical protein